MVVSSVSKRTRVASVQSKNGCYTCKYEVSAHCTLRCVSANPIFIETDVLSAMRQDRAVCAVHVPNVSVKDTAIRVGLLRKTSRPRLRQEALQSRLLRPFRIARTMMRAEVDLSYSLARRLKVARLAGPAIVALSSH